MSSKEQILQQVKDAKAEIARQKAELQKVIQANFHGLFQEIFAKYPVIESITWRQYTPYFNDGEACEFSANTDYPEINGADSYYFKNEFPDAGDPKPMFEDVVTFLQLFDDEDYEGMFNDHVQVTVTKTGIEVEEYNHD